MALLDLLPHSGRHSVTLSFLPPRKSSSRSCPWQWRDVVSKTDDKLSTQVMSMRLILQKTLATMPQEDILLGNGWKSSFSDSTTSKCKKCKVKKQAPKGRLQNGLHSFSEKKTLLWRLKNRHKHRVHQNLVAKILIFL